MPDNTTDTDAFRKRFEDEVFNRRFIASIQRVGAGCMTFMPVDCPTQAELMKRDPEHPDDYADEHISAMWYGAKLGARFAAKAQAAVPQDFITHKNPWRQALEIARDHAEVSPPDIDDRAYWEHELRAFDRAHAELEGK